MTCSHDQSAQRKELSLGKFQACLDSPASLNERLPKKRFDLVAVYKHYEIQQSLVLLSLGIGNLAVQYAKKVFNAHVIAVDINNDKLALAKEVGADIVINGLEVEDVPGLIKEKTNGGAHSAVVTAVSKVAFNQAVDSVRAGGRVVAVGLPSEMMDLSIVKTVLDGIQVIGSLVGTRKDLEEAFQFGAEGLVVPVVQKRPVEDAIAVFDEMAAGTIQGRMVLDFTH